MRTSATEVSGITPSQNQGHRQAPGSQHQCGITFFSPLCFLHTCWAELQGLIYHPLCSFAEEEGIKDSFNNMKLLLMTQRPIFPLGSPGGAERGGAGTSLGGTSSPLHTRAALLEGSATQPRVGLAGRKSSGSASQENSILAHTRLVLMVPRRHLSQVWGPFGYFSTLALFPSHVFSYLNHQHQKESSQIRLPLAVTCSSTAQNQRMSVRAMPLLWDTIWEETGFSELLAVLCLFTNFHLKYREQHPCTACPEAQASSFNAKATITPFLRGLETRKWKAVLQVAVGRYD